MKEEQVGTIFVWVGAIRGGGGGDSPFGPSAKNFGMGSTTFFNLLITLLFSNGKDGGFEVVQIKVFCEQGGYMQGFWFNPWHAEQIKDLQYKKLDPYLKGLFGDQEFALDVFARVFKVLARNQTVAGTVCNVVAMRPILLAAAGFLAPCLQNVFQVNMAILNFSFIRLFDQS